MNMGLILRGLTRRKIFLSLIHTIDVYVLYYKVQGSSWSGVPGCLKSSLCSSISEAALK